MIYFGTITALCIYLCFLNLNFIAAILASYLFALFKPFKNKKVEIVRGAAFLLAIYLIVINDVNSAFILVLIGMNFLSRPLELLSFVILFFLKPEFYDIFMYLAAGFTAVSFERIFKLDEYIKNAEIRKDKEALQKRLIEKTRREERYIYDERIKVEERKNLLGSLHHIIGHTLTGTILELKAFQIEHGYDEIGGTIERLEGGLKEIRKTLHTLSDENISLLNEAENLKNELQKNSIAFEYKINEKSMDKATKRELVELLKEGVTNIINHSESKEAKLEIIEEPGFFRISLYSDGEAPSEFTPGLGIISMERFSHARGGYFDIDTKDGFKIMMSYPKKR